MSALGDFFGWIMGDKYSTIRVLRRLACDKEEELASLKQAGKIADYEGPFINYDDDRIDYGVTCNQPLEFIEIKLLIDKEGNVIQRKDKDAAR